MPAYMQLTPILILFVALTAICVGVKYLLSKVNNEPFEGIDSSAKVSIFITILLLLIRMVLDIPY